MIDLYHAVVMFNANLGLPQRPAPDFADEPPGLIRRLLALLRPRKGGAVRTHEGGDAA